MSTVAKIYELLRQSEPLLLTRELYIPMLTANYKLMVASGPLLDLAAEVSAELPALTAYYTKHCAEEAWHAAALRKDIEAVAPPLQNALSWPAAGIAGTQYYLLYHAHPALLLGYLASMEFRPPTMAAVEVVEGWFGRKACTMLRHHAQVDVLHAKELADMIEQQPEDVQDCIFANAVQAIAKLDQYMSDALKLENAYVQP